MFAPTAPLAPMNVTAERTAQNSIQVSWTRLNLVQARGFVTFYTVAYTPVLQRTRRQPSQDTTETVTTGPSSSSVIITGMDGDLAYRISVSASTGAGAGEPSISLTVYPEGSPQARPESGDSAGPLIGSVIGILIAVVLLGIIVVVLILLK